MQWIYCTDALLLRIRLSVFALVLTPPCDDDSNDGAALEGGINPRIPACGPDS